MRLNMIAYLGNISTEGGPLIVVDSNIINNWNGVEGNDYVELCNVFDSDLTLEGFPINFKSNSPITWEQEGGGIVDIYKNGTGVILVKSWQSDDNPKIDETELATIPISEEHIPIGNLIINTSYLLIFHSTESLENACLDDSKHYGILNGDFAFDNSNLYIKTSVKEFSCICDKVDINKNCARRLHLIPIKHE